MKVIHNPVHALHHGRDEMFRGRMVACHEVPARQDFVLAALQQREFGQLEVPSLEEAALDAAIGSVHDSTYMSGPG